MAYLLWKNPGAHEVTRPLSKERCNALITDVGTLSDGDERGLERIIATLTEHVPAEHITETVRMLERWCTLGDGCTVASHRPPRLAGKVPHHLSAIWDRVPKL
eukprot:2656184-Prymnesium_polylepis.1